MKRLHHRHRKALAPFAEAYQDMVTRITELSDAELNSLHAAVDAVTDTNSSWQAYRAARVILPDILNEQRERALRAPQRGVTA